MKRYIKRNWLVILGFLALGVGIVLQAGTGKIDGSALIPLPLIYAALLLREPKKKPLPDCHQESGTKQNTLSAL